MRKAMNNSTVVRMGGGVLLSMLLAVSIASGEGFKYKGADIRWDNTIKYSTAIRTEAPDPNLMIDENFDDANNNFPRGSFFSNRVDLLSEFDIKTANFAIRVSGAGWYDSIYATSNNNTSSTSNNFSVASYHFPKATREYAARRFELLDGFVYVKKSLGESREWSMRIGRQTALWGTSLFMLTNSIAYGQAPTDFQKAAISPNIQSKELFMPVGQVTMSFKPTASMNIEGFYQFEERKSLMPAAGTYFAAFDAPDIGGERLLTGGGTALFRGQDIKAANSGNFGVAVHYKFRKPSWDTGYYFYQFNEHSSQMYVRPGLVPCPVCPGGILMNPSIVDLSVGKIGEFIYVYPEHVKLAGASLDANWGPVNIAGEVSLRWNMPLVSSALVDLSGLGLASVPDNNRNPLYAVGNTAHVNISVIYLISNTKFFQQANIVGEVGYNHLMKITKNPQNFDRNRSTDAFAFAGTFEPTYFKVLPHLDITVPIGIGYSPKARAASDAGFNGGADRGGYISPGVTFTYLKVWKGKVSFTHYWGKDSNLVSAGPNTGPTAGMQLSKGKDFVSISFQRTF